MVFSLLESVTFQAPKGKRFLHYFLYKSLNLKEIDETDAASAVIVFATRKWRETDAKRYH